jgi:CheY-like chemotaxis protein
MKKTRKMKVIIADESLTVQKQVNVALVSPHCEVIAAADGQDALQKVKMLRPDVLLADCALRYLDGFDLVDRIRSDSSLVHVRAILLKGQLPKGKERRLKEVRADEILSKPVDQKALIRALENVFAEEEESTAVQVDPSLSDDEKTPIVRVEKLEALNSKLSAIAEEVVGTRSADQEEITAKIHPKDFKRPVEVGSASERPQGSFPESLAKGDLSLDSVARDEIRKWISENMPRIVEKFVKDELFKFTKGSR